MWCLINAPLRDVNGRLGQWQVSFAREDAALYSDMLRTTEYTNADDGHTNKRITRNATLATNASLSLPIQRACNPYTNIKNQFYRAYISHIHIMIIQKSRPTQPRNRSLSACCRTCRASSPRPPPPTPRTEYTAPAQRRVQHATRTRTRTAE